MGCNGYEPKGRGFESLLAYHFLWETSDFFGNRLFFIFHETCKIALTGFYTLSAKELRIEELFA